MPPFASESRPLHHRLGLGDTASIIIGIIIGVGIFKTPATVFSLASGPWTALALWGFAGLLSLVGAFCFAELASTYPRSGGEYVYLTRAYGGWMGFLFAWAQLAVIRTGGSIAAVAYLFAYYAGTLFPLTPLGTTVLAGLTIAVLTLVNILGLRLGKGTQNLLTAAKLGGLAVIVLAAFLWASPARVLFEGRLVQATASGLVLDTGHSEQVQTVPANARVVVDGVERAEGGLAQRLEILQPGQRVQVLVRPGNPRPDLRVTTAAPPSRFGGLALAMILILWTYAGWHEGAYVAAEVENRRRNLPLALILGTGAVMFLYLLVNMAYLVGLGYDWAAGAPTVAADVLGLLPWTHGEQAMAALVMVSALGGINGMIITSSRIYTELGADHRLFAPLSRWDRRWGTPLRSLVVQAVICIIMVAVVGVCFAGNDGFDTLVKCSSPVFCVFFLLTGAALIVLRFKEPHVERPFVTPAYPLTPLVFCAFWGFMFIGSICYAPLEAAIGLGILLLGVPLYLVSRGWKSADKGELHEPLGTSVRDEGKQLTQC